MLKNGVTYENVSGTTPIAPDTARSVTEIFIAGEAITAGQWVKLDTGATGVARSYTVKIATGSATVGGAAVGVALETVASGAWVPVCIEGYCAVANVDSDATIAAADELMIGAVAGEAAETAATSLHSGVGLCLGTPASNQAVVFVYRKY